MATKKRSGKGRAAKTRDVKDLAVRKAKNVKGGKGKASPGDFSFTHTYDKASPVLG